MTARAHRPGPLLPKGQGERALAFVVAVLAALACLAAVAASATGRAARGWTRDLAASATVQVRASPGETPAEAARAAEALAGVRGVAEARALDRKAAVALLEPWLGVGAVPDDLPIPELVAVELNPAAPADAASLRHALEEAKVDGTVDDHARWLADVRRAAGAAFWAAVGVCLLISAAAAAVIAFATRSALAARRDVVEVLHLSGAEDPFVAGLLVRRFAWLAGRAAGGGAVAAAMVAVGVRLLGGASGFAPVLPVAWTDLLVVLPCPLLAALAAAWAARRTALALLRRRL